MSWIWIALSGALGVLLRAALTNLASVRDPMQTHFVTLGINVVGSLLIGVIYVLSMERIALSPTLRPILMIGFLGGFTTFSSYSFDVIKLLELGHFSRGLIYFALSPILGVAACYLGMELVRRL